MNVSLINRFILLFLSAKKKAENVNNIQLKLDYI